MKKDWVIAVSFGELILKGNNRQRFVRNAEKQINKSLREIPVKNTYSQLGMYFVEVEEEDIERAIKAIKKVFGIIYITPRLRVTKDLDVIAEACNYFIDRKLEEFEKQHPEKGTFSFKVEAKRADKSFPLNSVQIAQNIGGRILQHANQMKERLTVDVHNPDFRIWVDVREEAYVYLDRVHGLGGLPWGSGGRGLLLLSGGIDSPAAGFELARRGLALGAIHFHSYPFTSERAQDKAIRLAKQMSEYVGPMQVYMINLAEVYTAINKNCKSKNTTILSRRMMMRISDVIAQQYNYDALITGESLGQVASQTIQGITCVNDASKLPILRPFIATDKTEIIEIARNIETYEISIEPFDDCCSIFAPSRPNTKPRLYDMEFDEQNLDIEDLLQRALDTLEIITIE